MKTSIRYCFIFLGLMAHSLLSAEQYELKSDEVSQSHGAEARVEAGVRFEPVHWFDIHIEESARFSFDGTIKSYSKLQLNFPFSRYFGMGLEYAFIVKHSDEKNTQKHRVGGYAELTFHPGRWKISLKERPLLTMRFDSINSAEKNKYDWKLRSKLAVQYNVPGKPVKPYIAFELENTLNAKAITGYVYDEQTATTTTYDFKGNYINKIRPEIGVKYTPRKRHHFNFFYKFDTSFDRSYNITHKSSKLEVTRSKSFTHIFGVTYTFDAGKK
ncbi:MAG: hypothetical protein IJU35_00460 [Paludibacteraceae bacterium]|nr:hypothetical protein [Paludibacteraceae bacterium]